MIHDQAWDKLNGTAWGQALRSANCMYSMFCTFSKESLKMGSAYFWCSRDSTSIGHQSVLTLFDFCEKAFYWWKSFQAEECAGEEGRRGRALSGGPAGSSAYPAPVYYHVTPMLPRPRVNRSPLSNWQSPPNTPSSPKNY